MRTETPTNRGDGRYPPAAPAVGLNSADRRRPFDARPSSR
jgi:hypothetical protein